VFTLNCHEQPISDLRLSVPAGITVNRTGNWLRVAAPVESVEPVTGYSQLLKLNEPAGCFRLLPGNSMVADVPVSDSAFDSKTVPWVMSIAESRVHRDQNILPLNPQPADRDPLVVMQAAGWRCTRTESSIEISLGHVLVHYQEFDSIWTMEMPLDIDWHDLDPGQMEALSVYLLRTSMALKMVKPVLGTQDGRVRPAITVNGSVHVFDSWALSHAKNALVTATGMMSAQIHYLLRDPRVAELYLSYQEK
jgi:hypothetical protein